MMMMLLLSTTWKLTRTKNDVNDDDDVVVAHHLEVDKEEMEDFQCRALPRNLLDVIGTHLVMVIMMIGSL